MSKDKTVPEASAGTPAGQTEKLMYIGPSILSPIMLSHRSVYSALPHFLKNQTKEVRDTLGACFVPLSQAAAALRELEGTKEASLVTSNYKTAQRLMRSK